MDKPHRRNSPVITCSQDQYTGERLRRTNPAKYRRILRLLSEGVPVYKIESLCKVSEATVKAIKLRNSEEIAEKKKRLALLCLDVAESSFEKVEQQIGKAGLRDAGIIGGIAADKAVALTNDPNAAIAVAIEIDTEESLRLKAAVAKFLPPGVH